MFTLYETLREAKEWLKTIKKLILENSRCMNDDDKKDIIAEHRKCIML